MRLASIPEDSLLKVAGAAFTNVGSSPSPAGGTRLKNARGLPLAIVVFWDPAPYSATDAMLTWKKAEAEWRVGEEEQYRRGKEQGPKRHGVCRGRPQITP